MTPGLADKPREKRKDIARDLVGMKEADSENSSMWHRYSLYVWQKLREWRQDKENETQRAGRQRVLADVGQRSISAELNSPRGAEAFQRKRA